MDMLSKSSGCASLPPNMILVGGPDRPPSKRMLDQARADEAQARQAARSNKSAAGGEEGYWEYMQRQLNERTQKLGVVGDSVAKLEESSASWADQASKFVAQQKRNMVLGGEFRGVVFEKEAANHDQIAVKGKFF